MSAWFLANCSKTVLKRECLLIPRARHRKWTHRLFSSHCSLQNSSDKNNIVPSDKNCPEYVPLLTSIEERRREARRSVLVQVKDPSSAEDLYQYCSSKYGPVQGLHFYKNTSSKIFNNFFIVEFAHSDSVTTVLEQGHHSRDASKQGGAPPVPVCSPFLWFSGSHGPRPTQKSSPPPSIPVHYNHLPSGEVSGLEDVSEQIEQMWGSEAMTDVSQRIRFLVCRQIELALSGMFPFSSVLPFGSSVNSHGRHCCDLDMLLKLDGGTALKEDSRLVFHAKGAVYGGERAQVQKYCDEVSKIIQSFLPGCQEVQKILNARVPIIKFNQQLAGLECDLTMSNESGVHMSCLLHLWGHADWRVRPLVATVRRWAQEQRLVLSVRPTHYFTNFTLTMLVVFYLQVVHGMVPTVSQLVTLANPYDRYFLHDINLMKPHLNKCYDSQVSLEELLGGFFQFYKDFDFQNSALCVISGTVITKHAGWKNSSAMDITNPLEHDHNVSYNVNKTAVNMFKEKCQDSLQKLEMLRETKISRGVLHKGGLLWLLSKEPVPKGGKRHIKVADLGWMDPSGFLDQTQTQEPPPKNIHTQKDFTKQEIKRMRKGSPKPEEEIREVTNGSLKPEEDTRVMRKRSPKPEEDTRVMRKGSPKPEEEIRGVRQGSPKPEGVQQLTNKQVKVNELYNATGSVATQETASNDRKGVSKNKGDGIPKIKINNLFEHERKRKSRTTDSVKTDESGGDKSLAKNFYDNELKSMSEEERIEYLKQSLKNAETSGEPETTQSSHQQENLPQLEIIEDPEIPLKKNKQNNLDFLHTF